MGASLVAQNAKPFVSKRINGTGRPCYGGVMPDMSIRELRTRAARYREMAQTAQTRAMVNSLLRLVERFEELARRQEEDGETVA